MYSAYHKYLDDPFADEQEPEENPARPGLTCRRCGKGDGLYWLPNHTGKGFVMYDENGLHRCAMKPTADDFENLTQ